MEGGFKSPLWIWKRVVFIEFNTSKAQEIELISKPYQSKLESEEEVKLLEINSKELKEQFHTFEALLLKM